MLEIGIIIVSLLIGWNTNNFQADLKKHDLKKVCNSKSNYFEYENKLYRCIQYRIKE